MFLLNDVKKNEDRRVKSIELLKILNNIIFNRTSCSKIMCCGGWSLLGIYSTTQMKYIVPFVTNFVCGSAIVIGGISMSAWMISYFVYKKENDESDIVETEYEKYLNFINKDYELFIDIYKNEKEDYFTNENKTFINELKDCSNHETYELPYSYNPKLMFYYDNDSDTFHYYCQSDVSCKVLNSACRTYTITNKCIQLFQDEEEIQYMKGEASYDVDVSFSNVPEETTSTNSLGSTLSATEPEEGKEEGKEDEEEETNGFVNIFYNKKSKKENARRMTKIPQLKTNKFIYKGTLDEYNKDFLKKATVEKETSYEEYLTRCSK